MKDQRLVYCYNNNGDLYFVRSAEEKVPAGSKVILRYDFEKTGKEKYGAGGIGRLYIDDKKVGEGEIPHTIRFIYSLDESFDIGIDSGTPLTDDYNAYSRFTGTIRKVVVDLLGKQQAMDPETKARIIMKKG